MRMVLRLLLCLALLLLPTLAAFIWLPASSNYHITERYTFSAGENDTELYFGSLEPKSGPYQDVSNVRVRWEGEMTRESKKCVDVIKLTRHLPSGTQLEALVEYDLSVSYGLVFWRDEVRDYDLEPRESIESLHPLIRDRAAQITSGVSIVDAYRLYNFTKGHMHWTAGNSDCVSGASALSAYRSGVGECGEYARLMVALSRAAGIPARPISGILLPNLEFPGMSTSLHGEHPGQAHAWVEFSNRYIWTVADPIWGSVGLGIVQFGRNDGRHLRFGCAELEGVDYRELRDWAADNAPLSDKRFAALKYVLSTDAPDVRISPSVSIRKGWDGRWLNSFLALAGMTYLLCRFRDCCIRRMVVKNSRADSGS